MSQNPAPSPPQTPSLDTLLNHSAWTTIDGPPLPGKGWLRVTGADATRWLNGMLTNSIQALQPGAGCYNFVLNAQGKIQGDCTVFLDPAQGTEPALLLQTSSDQLETLRTWFDRFIIMDDVELADLEPGWQGLELAGPEAAALLDLPYPPSQPPAPLSLQTITREGRELTFIHAHSPLIPRYEVWAPAATLAALKATLPPPASAALFEQLRILEGVPRFGRDIRDRELPQETAPAGSQSRALHFSKGCYLGQEIVERIHSRGNLHRTFAGFTLSGDLPPAGTALTLASAPGKAIGELTSTTRLTVHGTEHLLALGYIRREALDREVLARAAHGEAILYPGGQAIPATLPFRVS